MQLYPHGSGDDNGFAHVGEIFSDETNPGRKKSFDIRKVMMAVVDQDHAPLERWAGMRAAETAVVWDAHLGGYPVCLIGIESQARTAARLCSGRWAGSVDRRNALSALLRRKWRAPSTPPATIGPWLLLANLSGFDGSPESMRNLQLEYGAEIGRAVVNFKGPMVFCVISRYHGGAYVVFSTGAEREPRGGGPWRDLRLGDRRCSRRGGGVRWRSRGEGPQGSASSGVERGASPRPKAQTRARLRAQIAELHKVVHSEKLGEVADEFDHVHTVHRALKVGALHRIIPPANAAPLSDRRAGAWDRAAAGKQYGGVRGGIHADRRLKW